MQTKQWVGVAVFGLVFGFAGLIQAGGVTDLKSGAVGAIRESVHEKADSAMDNVGLQEDKKAAEGAAADGNEAAGETAEATDVKGEAAKDAAVEGEAVEKPAEDAKPKPSAEDAAKDALKDLLY